MYLYLNPNGNICGGYTVVVLLLKLVSFKHSKLNIFFNVLMFKMWCIFVFNFFLTRSGNTDAFFNPTNTHPDKVCEGDELVQEEPDKSN